MSGTFQARLEPTELLATWLPALCQGLSLARSHIAVDQIRSALNRGFANRVVFITAGDEGNAKVPLAGAIAICPDSNAGAGDPVDAATVVHAGPLREFDDRLVESVAAALGQCLDHALRDQGITFVQWSTDDVSLQSSAPIARWCAALGFHSLATLDYRSVDLHRTVESAPALDSGQLEFRMLDWESEAEMREFELLVETTYCDTRDCPAIAKYRSASQTLRGYRASPAFHPSWWFRLNDRRTEQDAGCLVLAHHRSEDTDQEGGVAEIVYMGLIPAERGQGFGSEVVRHAKQIARTAGCSRVILAVDQANSFASSIYDQAGFRSMLWETVWGKTLRAPSQW